MRDWLDVFDTVGTDSLSNKLYSPSERRGLVVKEGLFQVNLWENTWKNMNSHTWTTCPQFFYRRQFAGSKPEVSAVNGWWKVPSVLQMWGWSCELSLRSWMYYQPQKQQEVYETPLSKEWHKDASITLNWNLFQPKLGKIHNFKPHFFRKQFTLT